LKFFKDLDVIAGQNSTFPIDFVRGPYLPQCSTTALPVTQTVMTVTNSSDIILLHQSGLGRSQISCSANDPHLPSYL